MPAFFVLLVRQGLALSAAVLVAGCLDASPPPSASPAPSPDILANDWAAASLDLDAAGFACARATDTPAELRATAGPAVTHAQVLDQCRQRLQESRDAIHVYDQSLIHSHETAQATRDRIDALAVRLDSLLAEAQAAAGADDMAALAPLRTQIADLEGSMLAAGA